MVNITDSLMKCASKREQVCIEEFIGVQSSLYLKITIRIMLAGRHMQSTLMSHHAIISSYYWMPVLVFFFNDYLQCCHK